MVFVNNLPRKFSSSRSALIQLRVPLLREEDLPSKKVPTAKKIPTAKKMGQMRKKTAQTRKNTAPARKRMVATRKKMAPSREKMASTKKMGQSLGEERRHPESNIHHQRESSQAGKGRQLSEMSWHGGSCTSEVRGQ